MYSKLPQTEESSSSDDQSDRDERKSHNSGSLLGHDDRTSAFKAWVTQKRPESPPDTTQRRNSCLERFLVFSPCGSDEETDMNNSHCQTAGTTHSQMAETANCQEAGTANCQEAGTAYFGASEEEGLTRQTGTGEDDEAAKDSEISKKVMMVKPCVRISPFD